MCVGRIDLRTVTAGDSQVLFCCNAVNLTSYIFVNRPDCKDERDSSSALNFCNRYKIVPILFANGFGMLIRQATVTIFRITYQFIELRKCHSLIPCVLASQGMIDSI